MSPEPPPIRRARSTDIPALAALEKDAYNAYRDVGMGALSDRVAMPHAEFERGIGDGTLFVIDDPTTADGDTRPVASVLFGWREGAAYVDQLCVARRAARRGLGRALLDAVEFSAGSRGITALFLTTYADVPWNQPFYERLGWRTLDPAEQPDWLARTVEAQAADGFARWPRVTMTKALDVPTLGTPVLDVPTPPGPAAPLPRIRLRPWRIDDAPAVQAVADDPLVPLITSVPTSGRRDDAEAFVRRQQQRLGEGAGFAFAIALGQTDEAVGHLGVWTRDIDHGRATIGYWMVAEHRGRGLLTDALRTATRWALTQPDVERVDLFVEPWNEGSWRAAERCGYEREGLLRHWQRVGDEARDMFSYSMIRR